MDKKVLLLSSLLGLLVLSAVGFWWLSCEQQVALSASASDHAAHAATADAQGMPGPGDATLTKTVASTVRADAATASASGLPFPEDARWVPVLVIDKATREPVAGADVGWVGENFEKYTAEQNLIDPDSMFLWRSIDLQVDRAGWRTTTDEHGIARVTFKEWTTVIATDAGRFARLTLRENTVAPPGGYVLELMPDLALTVQVLDEGGEPAAGVLLAVGIHDDPEQPQHFWGWGPIARTDADGRAVLRHLQQLLEEEDTEPAGAVRTPRWCARTYIPGYDDPGIPFTLDALPAEPIVLRLPACGSVRLRAEIAGRPAPGFVSASLVQCIEQPNYRPDTAQLYRPIAADGWVRFPHIPLGREFIGSSNTNGDLSTRFVGPIARGQEVMVRITPENDTMVLGGRMLTGDRQPIRNGSFVLMADGQNVNTYQNFRTDEQGRFLVAVGESRDDNHVDTLRFEYQRYAEPSLRIDLPGRTLRPGVEDLGDLTVSGGKLVVAGTFVDDSGPLHKNVSFWVEHFEPTAAPNEAWQGTTDTMQHQDKTGHFEVRGEVPAGRLRLAFASHDQLPMEPIEFEAGNEHLEVRIDTGHQLAATILLTTGMPQEGLYAVLQPVQPDPDPAAARRDEDRFRVEPWSEDGERRNLQWEALRAGSYTLSVYLWTRAQPLLVIPDVMVPGPTGGDPRLADIDLRAAVRTVLLCLFDDTGTPLESPGGVAFAVGQDPGSTWQGTQLWEAKTKVLVPASGSTELLVAVQDHRPRMVAVNGAELDVRLDPWPTLEVVLTGVPTLPEKVRLLAHLQPKSPNEAPYRSQWSSGRRGEMFDVGESRVAVAAGRATVPIGEGPHRVVLELVDNHRRIELSGIEPGVVLPNSERVFVTVPAAQWTAALAKFAPEPEPK